MESGVFAAKSKALRSSRSRGLPMQRPNWSLGSLPSTASSSKRFSTVFHPSLPPEALSKKRSPLKPIRALEPRLEIFRLSTPTSVTSCCTPDLIFARLVGLAGQASAAGAMGAPPWETTMLSSSGTGGRMLTGSSAVLIAMLPASGDLAASRGTSDGGSQAISVLATSEWGEVKYWCIWADRERALPHDSHAK